MYCPLTEISQDCVTHILSYLSLRDCLTFGLTSKHSLQTLIIDDLRKRHRNLVTSRRLNQERLVVLYESLPSSHPLLPRVRSLLSSVKAIPSPPKHTTLLHTHRLLTEILNRAMIPQDAIAPTYSVPSMRKQHSSPWVKTTLGQQTFELPLARYVGDALIVFFLLPSSSTAPGSGAQDATHLTLDAWMYRIQLELTRQKLASATWYHIWIFLHSTLLKLLPSPLFADLEPNFQSLVERVDPQSHWRLRLVLRKIRDKFQACSPRFSFYEFGSLGPTFRGRDVVRSFDIITSTVCTLSMEVLDQHCYVTEREDANGELSVEEYNEAQRSGVILKRSLEWLFKIHVEAGRRRPMNVQVPTISFMTRF